MPQETSTPKRKNSLQIQVLGSTGSVGQSCMRVVREQPDRLSVVGLAARGGNPDCLMEQIREFTPSMVAVSDPEVGLALRGAVPEGVEVLIGHDAAVEMVNRQRCDRVVAAIVGAAGLAPVHAALKRGVDVALANKESLVVAGGLLMRLSAATGAQILPVDSEHAAIHQALRGGTPDEVRSLVLTASGGPFRKHQGSLDAVTRAEALAHPTWEMGAKISVDSATLMNKGLELIEATHLFGVDESRIDVVVHPQSIVHSLVEFCDGSWLAQMSYNDMVFPVQYALAYPERWGNDFPRLRLDTLGQLDFGPVDHDRFPAIRLARRALSLGDSGPVVFNAANEIAVHAFLEGEIRFTKIFEVVHQLLDETGDRLDSSEEYLSELADVLALDAETRLRSIQLLS